MIFKSLSKFPHPFFMDPACAGDCARMMAPWCSDGAMASAPGDPGGFGLRRAKASTRQRPSRGSKPLA